MGNGPAARRDDGFELIAHVPDGIAAARPYDVHVNDPETFDPGGRFRAEVAASQLDDPMPGIQVLADRLGLPADQVAHHALVRWMTAGSEALLAAPPEMLVALRGAAEAGDVERVRGITDALLAGWDG
jgi:hypothetical protein